MQNIKSYSRKSCAFYMYIGQCIVSIWSTLLSLLGKSQYETWLEPNTRPVTCCILLCNSIPVYSLGRGIPESPALGMQQKLLHVSIMYNGTLRGGGKGCCCPLIG